MEMIIAGASLILSLLTLWLSYLNKGTVKMTQPTTIFFGPDDKKSPKIYLRTLLFSSSQRGRIIESMYVKLITKERTQIFNIWVYGERVEIVRGSGLFVRGTGIAFNHHFLMPKHGEKFEFLEGNYELKVYASLLNEKKSIQLFSVSLR